MENWQAIWQQKKAGQWEKFIDFKKRAQNVWYEPFYRSLLGLLQLARVLQENVAQKGKLSGNVNKQTHFEAISKNYLIF